MENTSQATLKAATNTPYLASLYATAAWGADYHGVAHPSLPNYVALTSGGTQGIGCDCQPMGSAVARFSCDTSENAKSMSASRAKAGAIGTDVSGSKSAGAHGMQMLSPLMSR